MSIVVNIYYNGKNGSAKAFAEEMTASGIVEQIRNEEGNEGYEYFYSASDQETVLLVDRWKDEQALDMHHKTPMMRQIAVLRKKYDLRMKVERFEKLNS